MQSLYAVNRQPRFGNHFVVRYERSKVTPDQIQAAIKDALTQANSEFPFVKKADTLALKIARAHLDRVTPAVTTRKNTVHVEVNTNRVEFAPLQNVLNNQVSAALRALPGFQALHEFEVPPSFLDKLKLLF